MSNTSKRGWFALSTLAPFLTIATTLPAWADGKIVYEKSLKALFALLILSVLWRTARTHLLLAAVPGLLRFAYRERARCVRILACVRVVVSSEHCGFCEMGPYELAPGALVDIDLPVRLALE